MGLILVHLDSLDSEQHQHAAFDEHSNGLASVIEMGHSAESHVLFG
jgi:hypothetical protein